LKASEVFEIDESLVVLIRTEERAEEITSVGSDAFFYSKP